MTDDLRPIDRTVLDVLTDLGSPSLETLTRSTFGDRELVERSLERLRARGFVHPDRVELVGGGGELATASGGVPLVCAAAGSTGVDVEARTIEGLAVPYGGKVGQTSQGSLTFTRGALRWSEPRRVKLLREHDQRDVVGYGLELEERPEGLWARFHVPEGDEGDRALAQAASGLRDALSVGVQLDEPTRTRLARSKGQPVPGSGALREVSLVSVPAFDDARLGSVAASGLVVSSWHDAPDTNPNPDPEVQLMPCQLCGTNHAPSVACPSTTTATASSSSSTPDSTTTTPQQPATASGGAQLPASSPAPTPVPERSPLAVAGAAHTTGEPSTYTFSGDGPSLVRDAYMTAVHRDSEAGERFHRFATEVATGNPASLMALAAVTTRDTADVAPAVPDATTRANALVRAVDRGRPFVSRLPRVPLNNATPFYVPVEGEFDGVAAHTEGTAHVPEGTLGLTEVLVTPRAMSGAFRVSRELVDSSNPAVDTIALRAMVRDYQRETEAAAIAALIAAAPAPANGDRELVDTVAELRAQLSAYMGANDDQLPDAVAASYGLWDALLADTDTTGRPMLPFVGPSNASGTLRAGATGASVDGVELFRASGLPADEGLIYANEAVLVGESNVQTFRFEQVEGPGVIKLAIWGYFAAAVTRATGVRRITRADIAATV